MTGWRRFEVMLPLQSNNGKRIPRKWMGDALAEVLGPSALQVSRLKESKSIGGHGAVVYRGKQAQLFVDLPDTPRNRTWMKQCKGRWKKRLQQLEIWMVSYRIEVE